MIIGIGLVWLLNLSYIRTWMYVVECCRAKPVWTVLPNPHHRIEAVTKTIFMFCEFHLFVFIMTWSESCRFQHLLTTFYETMGNILHTSLPQLFQKLKWKIQSYHLTAMPPFSYILKLFVPYI